MLRKSYKTILSTETGFKKALKKVIYDIDERLKKITSGEALQELYATKDHNHDSIYSLVGHQHEDLYSPLTHFHDQYLEKTETAFNSDRLGMLEADEYALKHHTHSHIAYVTPFVVPTVNTGAVTIDLDMNPTDVYVLDDNDKFQVENIISNTVRLSYELGEDNTKTSFILIYWNKYGENRQDTNVQLDNVEVHIGEENDITATVFDNNGNRVSEGVVDYSINFIDTGDEP